MVLDIFGVKLKYTNGTENRDKKEKGNETNFQF